MKIADERAGLSTPGASSLNTALEGLGLTLQRLRLNYDLTLEGLAERSGVSIATLSQLERGQGNPSLATLLKIAAGLKVPVAAFFQADDGAEGIVVRSRHRKRLPVSGEGRRYELISPNIKGRIEMLWVSLEPGIWTEDKLISHEGEECLFVLEGRIEAQVGESGSHILEAGDSIYVMSETPHSYRSTEHGPAQFVVAITPPSF